MGMTLHVVGFAPPDDVWKKMKTVYDACLSAGVDIPNDVRKFFNYEAPEDAGVIVDLDKIVREWQDNGSEGYELDLADLPRHVRTLRFYASW